MSISQYKESSLCFENTTDAELLVWLWMYTTFLFSFISLAWRNTLSKDKSYWFIFSHSLLCKYCHNKEILQYTVKCNSLKKSLWELQVIHRKYVSFLNYSPSCSMNSQPSWTNNAIIEELVWLLWSKTQDWLKFNYTPWFNLTRFNHDIEIKSDVFVMCFTKLFIIACG